MIGVVSRVDADGVWVEKIAELPGQELGPLKALRYRISTAPDAFTTYAEGDIVEVRENNPNDFTVAGIVDPE